MTVARGNLDSGHADVPGIDLTGEQAGPLHPGEHICAWLTKACMSADELATAMEVPVEGLNAVIAGERPLSAHLAVRLGKVTDIDYETWLDRQMDFDLKMLEIALGNGAL